MLRYCLVLLLLLPYLLGVGAGAVGRPEPTGPSAAHPYVHSAACQHQNYLRLDCFDTCNGDQTAVQAQRHHPTAAQLLTAFKGIDLHCLPALLLPLPGKPSRAFAAYQPATAASIRPGITTAIYQPPRRR